MVRRVAHDISYTNADIYVVRIVGPVRPICDQDANFSITF